ncbi:hypothetical protein ACW7BJ_33130 [Azospirillum argentinense]
MLRSLLAANGELDRSADALSFAERYEEVNASLGRDPILRGAWGEYRESLLLPRTTGRPVRSTTRPAAWFNLDLLRGPAIETDLRYHAAMPNLLVGAGLLFTFLGLAVALGSAGEVVTGTAAERNGALRQLLDTASFKFITSLMGMLLSIVYAVIRKHRLKQVERALDRFHAALELRIPLMTPAALQQETNELLARQSDYFESFTNDLAVSLGSAMDRAFDTRLGEHIGPLADSMGRLADGMASRNEDAMRSMLDAFLEKLQGGTGDRMQGVAETLSGLGARLEGLQQGLGDAAVRMAQSADAMAARMGEGAEAALSRITDQMGGLTETLRAVAEQSRTAGAEAGQHMASRIEAAATGFEEAARGVAATLAQAAAAMETTMGRQAEESGARLSASVEAMVAELRALAEGSRNAGTEAFSQLAARVAETTAGLERSVERMSAGLERAASDGGSALGQGAEQAVNRIADATEGMRTELQAMMADLRTALGQAGDALRESGTASAATLRTALGEAGDGVATALNGAADRLGRAGNEAAAALRKGGEAAGGSMRDAGGLVGERAGGLAGQIAALGQAATTLASRSTEFEHAAAKAAEPLSQAADTMNAASQSARAAMEPLAKASLEVSRAVEQVAGTATRFTTVLDAAQKLTTSLDGAAQRFEGVDRELAKTLAALQTGLQGFTREITDFVSQTDQNLAKAATQLGSLVQNLEATLEDFIPAVR